MQETHVQRRPPVFLMVLVEIDLHRSSIVIVSFFVSTRSFIRGMNSLIPPPSCRHGRHSQSQSSTRSGITPCGLSPGTQVDDKVKSYTHLTIIAILCVGTRGGFTADSSIGDV